jgi:3D (Asp-Asp-Asp) domain-containing protein
MSKNIINSSSEEPPLILSVLAIVSIIFYSISPQYSTLANLNSSNNTKQRISQYRSEKLSNKSIILVQKSAILSQSSHETESINKSKLNTRKKLVIATAYSSTVDQTDSTPFITASGTPVRDGVIAANFLKFGTKVKFPSLYGNKVFTVEDRMKSNYKVDIWFPTRQKAKSFGVKRVEMEIL